MARPEKPIDPQAPYAAFAHQLRKLRDSAGSPAYKALARKTGYSVATLSQAASGWRLPSLEVTRAYATACGGTEQHWEEQWMIARQDDLPWFIHGGAWSTRPPGPGTAANVTDFLDCLRALKIWAGDPSYTMLARHVGMWSKSATADALAPSRTRLPGLGLVLEIVRGLVSLRRPGEAFGEAYLTEWRQAWVRLAAVERTVTRRLAVTPHVIPPQAAGEVSTPKALPHTSGRTVNELAAVDEALPPPVRDLTVELRGLFSLLGVSTRRYARRRHLDASTLSRYLSGRRLPPWGFVITLIDDVAEQRGSQPLQETVARLRSLHRAALMSATTASSRVMLLEAQVSSLEELLAKTVKERDALVEAQQTQGARRRTA
ncbi:helix-turn-helix domain-containing protein [Streptomyces sp. NPDC059468]|uniref:helix-turn-helix domain-containing protein n=1 Tax=Streptomyces sp. NPDC059468 TaxID=3346845 RepID=UPI00367FDFA3